MTSFISTLSFAVFLTLAALAAGCSPTGPSPLKTFCDSTVPPFISCPTSSQR